MNQTLSDILSEIQRIQERNSELINQATELKKNQPQTEQSQTEQSQTEQSQLIEDNNKKIRKQISQIRSMIKEKETYSDLIQQIHGKEQLLIQSLCNEDAKTRKNTALLLGDIAQGLSDESTAEQCMQALFHGYQEEKQLFVKSAYLIALKEYDYRSILDSLKIRLTELTQYVPEESEKKHISEEIHALEDLILSMGEVQRHVFNGYDVCSDLLLTCNRHNVETVEAQIKEIADIDPSQIQTFSAGILLRTDCIAQVQKIRTYQELFFRVSGMETVEMDVKKAAEKIASSKLLSFLEKRHKVSAADQPFIFRIELKSKMDLATKSTFVKKLSAGIEQLTHRKLVNNKSNYELELRLIETKSGNYNCLIKLFTMPDERFQYRKDSVAASIRPDNAALLVELAKEYMIPDARVLDPFCGVATLLIERQKIVKANTSYGIDIYEEAIEKAKANTERAGQIIHFIHKDFFDFEHLYLFDEIFTDLPFETGHKSEEEIESIYQKFFGKAKKLLTGNGRIILYTHNREFVREYAEKAGFTILKHVVILEKAGTDLFVLEVQ